MKFSLFALTAFLFSSASADFSFRAATNQLLGKQNADNANVRVVVHGMKHEATSEDISIIRKAVKLAYNKAYGPAGYTMNSFNAKSAAAIPEFVGLTQPDCCLCPNDGDTMAFQDSDLNRQMVLAYVQDDNVVAAFKNTQELQAFHSSFESEFCALLRQSGSANLAHAHACSFSFLDMASQSHVSVPIKGKPSKNTEAQVILCGTLHEFSEHDMKLVDESIMAVYDEAFLSVGYSLGAFRTVADISMPAHLEQPNCRLCPNNDDAMVVSEAMLLVARVTPVTQPECGLCPNDVTTAVSNKKLTFMHTAFEKAFCQKLNNSGSANFADVHGCNVRFVHNADAKPKITQA